MDNHHPTTPFVDEDSPMTTTRDAFADIFYNRCGALTFTGGRVNLDSLHIDGRSINNDDHKSLGGGRSGGLSNGGRQQPDRMFEGLGQKSQNMYSGNEANKQLSPGLDRQQAAISGNNHSMQMIGAGIATSGASNFFECQ